MKKNSNIHLKHKKNRRLIVNERDGGRLSMSSMQQGATLLEAVIAMLIFSVGALGLAAMQLNAMSASGGSQQRSAVLWKAQDLADRIRANPGLAATYVSRIGSNLNTFGTDSAANLIQCGQGNYAQPSVLCSDSFDANAATCSNAQTVAFDVWEVFCEASTGVAVVGDDTGNALANGSVGLVNLEVVLVQNSVVLGDPDDDMLLYFEWASRESDSNQGLAGAGQQIATNLCGLDRQVAANLGVYCLRFRP